MAGQIKVCSVSEIGPPTTADYDDQHYRPAGGGLTPTNRAGPTIVKSAPRAVIGNWPATADTTKTPSRTIAKRGIGIYGLSHAHDEGEWASFTTVKMTKPLLATPL
jgi:hypothetical protein